MTLPGDEGLNARLTKIETGLSAVQQDVSVLRQDLSDVRQDVSAMRQDIGGVESRLRALIEDSRAEARTRFDGLARMFERFEARLEELNHTWKSADADRKNVLADHARRISALERRR